MMARPILMSGPMVRALIEERKTKTRRIVKVRPENHTRVGPVSQQAHIASPEALKHCPYGKPGDLLWVRETCRAEELSRPPRERRATRRERQAYGRTTVIELDELDGHDGVRYPADDAWRLIENSREAADRWFDLLHYGNKPPARGVGALVPSIHMPRWASRLTLRITDVRVERLQDISEADAIGEGVEPPSAEREDPDWSICPACGGTGLHGSLGEHLGYREVDCTDCDTHAKRYRHLWNHINGPGSWDANPWTWVLSFEVIKQNVDQLTKEAA